MSSSSASVLYGITVNVHDLIRGARAFTKLTRNTIVLDLLLARKKRPTTGVLVPCTSGHRHLSPSSSLSTLPAELLLLIRDHLRHSYIAAEPSYWVKELHWTVYAAINEDWNLARNWRKPWSDELWTWHTEIDGCDLCMNIIYGAGDAFHDGADTTCVRPTCHCNKRAIELLRRLLQHYGLSLPTTYYFNVTYDADPRFFSIAISLPVARENSAKKAFSASEDHQTASSYHTIPYEEPNLQIPTYLDPSYFQTSDDDDRKFRRLVQDLELRIAEIEGGTAMRWTKKEVEEKSPAVEKDVREGEAKEGRRGRAEGEDGAEDARAQEPRAVQPRGMLVHSSVAFW